MAEDARRTEPFVKVLLVLVGSLVSAGIIAQVRIAYVAGQERTEIRTSLKHATGDLESMSSQLSQAMAEVRRLEHLLSEAGANHVVLKAELAELRRRLETLEGKP